MVKTRSAPDQDAMAAKDRNYQHTAGATSQTEPTPVPPKSTGADPQSPSLDILSIINQDIASLSPEGKTIVGAIVKALQVMSDAKDQCIMQLRKKVTTLENKVTDLENHIDEISQYERRDTIILSGPALPQVNNNENSTLVAANAIKDNLKINFSPVDINVAHRIGNKSAQNRPMIVKLHSRQKKDDIMTACLTVRPNLYINESLTPKRLGLFKVIWNIRKNNRDLFQQLYTKDGKIYIKLKCSNQKHIITNETMLDNFLENFPVLRTTSSA